MQLLMCVVVMILAVFMGCSRSGPTDADQQKTQTTKPRPIIRDVTAERIIITDLGISVLQEFEDSRRVAFKAKLTNHNEFPAKMDVRFEFVDKDGFALESVPIIETQKLAPEQSKVVSGRYVFKDELFNRIDSYIARIELR